jgi:hypothetical protein
MECLKSELDIFHIRTIQTSIINTHTVSYKPIAPAHNPAQLEFYCSGHSDYYIDLNSIRLLVKIKLLKSDGSEDGNTVATVNNLLHSLFSSLAVSLNGKLISLHENNYHCSAYLESVLNYGSDASQTRPVTNFWFLDTPAGDGSLKADATNKGYAKRL